MRNVREKLEKEKKDLVNEVSIGDYIAPEPLLSPYAINE